MDDEALREQIRGLLASGLETAWQRRASTSEEAAAIARSLQDAADVEAKLVTAGFLDHPYVPQHDETGLKHDCRYCMYFEQHRRHCVFPELDLPVEPEWSCVLWRV